MSLVSMTDMLRKARAGGYAVGQFNMNNLEFLQAIIEAAEEERSPVIIGLSEGALSYMGFDYAVALVKTAGERASVPVACHLDHGPSFAYAMRCIRAGFTSVMIDASHHPFEENVRITRQVLEAASAVGVSVEAEIGRIGGTEDLLNVDEREAHMTDPDEAVRFYREVEGIDCLAISFGSAHGHYKGTPQLDFARLRRVTSQIPVPVVLHGASGIPDDQIREAIAGGVGKINVNTDNQEAFTRAVREVLAQDSTVYDPRKYLIRGKEAAREMVRAKIRLFGSAGKA